MVSAVSLEVWIGTVVGLLAIMALDLVVIARRGHAVTVRDATRWVIFYVGLAVVFGVGLYAFGTADQGSEFVAGYITEYSLSVDNLFVFVIIMSRFAVPPLAEDKALYIGIVLSLVMRAVLIAAGAAAISAASWVFYFFGAFLIYTAIRLARDDDDGGAADFARNPAVRAIRRVIPLSDDYEGARILAKVGGRRVATPLLVVVAAIGVANVVFALDSIPAIFGLTQDAYVVFTANAFALMGLRQLYFLIGGLLDRVVYLNVGLSIILGFIGAKLVIEALHGSSIDHVGQIEIPEIGIITSLTFIVATLAVTFAVSLAKTRRSAGLDPEEG